MPLFYCYLSTVCQGFLQYRPYLVLFLYIIENVPTVFIYCGLYFIKIYDIGIYIQILYNMLGPPIFIKRILYIIQLLL